MNQPLTQKTLPSMYREIYLLAEGIFGPPDVVEAGKRSFYIYHDMKFILKVSGRYRVDIYDITEAAVPLTNKYLLQLIIYDLKKLKKHGSNKR